MIISAPVYATKINMRDKFAGPSLRAVFGISSYEITSGKLLFGKLGKARITAQFSKVGEVLEANVIGLYGATEKGMATTLRRLVGSILEFAKEEGLSEVKLQAVLVTNAKLEAKLINHGFKQINVTIEESRYSAYTKTIKVE